MVCVLKSYRSSRWADIEKFEFRLTLMTIMFIGLILKINISPFIWDRVTFWEIVRKILKPNSYLPSGIWK